MLKYTLKRLLGALFSLFVIVTVIFILLRFMPIEGFLGANYDKLSADTVQSLLNEKGLLDPIPVQLMHFYGDLLHGDLGESWVYRTGYPIADILKTKIPISLKIGLWSQVLALAAGIPMGAFMAHKKGQIWDKLGTGFIVVVEALPAAIYHLFIQLYGTSLTGLPLVYSASNPVSLILPIVSISLGSIAGYALWMRRYMLDNMNMDYVKLAQAKGVSGRDIMMKHVFRNAFVPMAQFLPGSILMTIIGSIYVEHLYSIPGTGGLLIDVIQRQDNSMIQVLVLLYSAIGILGMFLGDFFMGLLDPRIKLAKGEGNR